MHEGQFTEKIVEVILSELKKYPGARIKTVKAKVGEIFHLILESVQMHFQIITKGSPLEGVQLDLEEEPVNVLCRQCQRKGPVEDHHMLVCSFCQSMDVAAVSGNRITVESIQMEK